jgi:hypothetical protein
MYPLSKHGIDSLRGTIQLADTARIVFAIRELQHQDDVTACAERCTKRRDDAERIFSLELTRNIERKQEHIHIIWQIEV